MLCNKLPSHYQYESQTCQGTPIVSNYFFQQCVKQAENVSTLTSTNGTHFTQKRYPTGDCTGEPRVMSARFGCSYPQMNFGSREPTRPAPGQIGLLYFYGTTCRMNTRYGFQKMKTGCVVS